MTDVLNITRDVVNETETEEPASRGNNGGGRRKIEVDLEQIEQHAARGLNKESIARCLGISPTTLYAKQKESEEIEAAIARGRAQGEKIIANRLFEAAKGGHIEAAKFFLARRCDWRETTNSEISGKNGAPVEVASVPMPDVSQMKPIDALKAYDEWMATLNGRKG